MMPLTQAQKTALKADIAANTALITVNGLPVQIKNADGGNSGDAANQIALWYQLLANPPFFGNYASVPLAVVTGAIDWKKLTPGQTIPTADLMLNAGWQARALACQGFTLNLQSILLAAARSGTGIALLDCTQKKVVAGLKDALSTVPSKNDGTEQDAGWAGAGGVQQSICRQA